MKTQLVLITAIFASLMKVYCQTDSLKNIDDLYMDFATPEISAFSIMGIEPSSISKPGNLKEFALGITNYVSATGNLNAGLAVEWAPFMTFNKKTGNWENKSDNKNKFEWKNWTTSIATTNDSTNVKLAGAIRFSPIDRTNPLNDKEWVDSISAYFYHVVNQREIAEEKIDNTRRMFTEKIFNTLIRIGVTDSKQLEALSAPLDINSYILNSLKEKLDTSGVFFDRTTITNDVFDSLKKQFIENELTVVFEQNITEIKSLCSDFADIFYQYHSSPSFNTEFNLHILKMKEDFKKANWNKWALQVSGGGLFNSEEANLNDLDGQYYTLAFTTGFPLIGEKWFKKKKAFNSFMRQHSQVIFNLKNQQYFNSDSINSNSLYVGARFLLGNYDKRFSFEIAYINFSNETTDLNSSGIRYTIGTEIKIMDNYWLELAVGGQNFEDKTGVNILPTFAFRHAFGNENRFFKKQ